jgi:membrane-bound lytic murein transglycosylase D
MFGDWHLALAAYNWGEGSVGRAIARNRKAGLGISYTELNMPAETRMYVPKLQAVKNIVNTPDAFNAELPLIENHPYFQTVDISRDIDVELVAKFADVTLTDFRALNPSLSKPVIFAAGTPQILLPWDNAKLYQRNLEAYDKGQYSSWTVWTVPKTLTVADAAQRVGMSESGLRSINNIPPRMVIKAGSTLMVPRSAGMLADVSSHIADNGQIALAPEILTRRSIVKAKNRDTVASLARRYQVSASNVADWNDIKVGTALKAGQQMVVFLPLRAAAPTASSRERASTKSSAARSGKTAARTSPKGGASSKVKKR